MLIKNVSKILHFPDSNDSVGGVATLPAGQTMQSATLPTGQKTGRDAMLAPEGEQLSGEEFGIHIEPLAGEKKSDLDLDDGNKNLKDPPAEKKVEAKSDDKTQQTQQQTQQKQEENPIVDAFKSLNKPADQQQQQQASGDKPVVYKPMPDADKRDYTGFDPADIPALKSMPNEPFNYLKTRLPALVKRATEAESQVQQLVKDNGTPLNYFENPQGFMLNPFWQDTNRKFDLATKEESHFATQLDAVRKGAAVYKRAVRYNEKGELETTDVAIDDKNRQQVSDELVQSLGRIGDLKQNLIGQASKLESQHVQMNQAVVKQINDTGDKYFPFYKEGEKTWTPELKKEYGAFINMLHPAVQQNPLAPWLAKSFLLIKAMNVVIADYRKSGATSTNQQQQQQKQQEEQLSGPTGGDVSANGGGNQQGSVLDDKGWEDEAR